MIISVILFISFIMAVITVLRRIIVGFIVLINHGTEIHDEAREIIRSKYQHKWLIGKIIRFIFAFAKTWYKYLINYDYAHMVNRKCDYDLLSKALREVSDKESKIDSKRREIEMEL